MRRAFAAIIVRDIRLALRAGSDALTLVLFFVMIGIVVPFAIGPDRVLLAQLAPAIVWIAAFLASLIGIDRVFRDDFEDGTLMLLRHGTLPMELVVLAKLIVHWLLTAFPLILATPVLAVLLAMDPGALWRTVISLILGTPGLAALGAIGAGITVSLRRGGLVAPVLVLPFAIPILIFGVGAIASGIGPDLTGSARLLLAAISLMLVAIAPFAAALAVRAGED
ncbi:heme exporter protein B [Devosia pacifica]|uniref:Heme exporter protein B n=1 Tax=Devosia pacifica TaxID=1335967 RepID=A0A918S714_9HYPH|nr:heme exporter protein CcmB [Devosia pacifica]GHA24162.1 heme exporter protein B [Devosia pacifica]